MINLLSYLPGKRKSTGSGWISFNAPCCTHQGESQDRRQRGGFKTSDQGWSYHCFNCGFTASFINGRALSVKAKKLLSWLNVPQEEIEKINLESLRHKSISGILSERQLVENQLLGINFKECDLPPTAELITHEHQQHWQYLQSRNVPMDYPFMSSIINDGIHWTRPHVLVPFTYNQTVVGFTTRFLDDRIPKYINQIPHGYVFGTDLQKSNWQHVFVMEGVFDALAISGLAVLHADVNDAQVRLIRSLGKEITVIPDQDEAGMKLVDRAVELGWAVSIPTWPNGCKDVNDAVIKIGKLATLMTVLQHRETSRIKIEMRRKQIVKQHKNI